MIELIPAIDLIDGKCVRLSKGDYASKKVYNENPVEVAKEMEAYGIRRLHVVDLDGAASQHVVNYRTLERIASATGLIIDFGGGVKSDEDLVIAFDNGAQMVTVGSIAVKQPDLFGKWLEQYGPEKMILGADVKGRNIAVSGWKEESRQELLPRSMTAAMRGVSLPVPAPGAGNPRSRRPRPGRAAEGSPSASDPSEKRSPAETPSGPPLCLSS